jgi:hypothetical protein
VTAIAVLVGLQMLTCGADPLPQVRRLVIELDHESSGSVVEEAVRLLVFAVIAGLVLGRLGA